MYFNFYNWRNATCIDANVLKDLSSCFIPCTVNKAFACFCFDEVNSKFTNGSLNFRKSLWEKDTIYLYYD